MTLACSVDKVVGDSGAVKVIVAISGYLPNLSFNLSDWKPIDVGAGTNVGTVLRGPELSSFSIPATERVLPCQGNPIDSIADTWLVDCSGQCWSITV